MTESVSTGDGDNRTPLHLFQAYGIEIEYMIVDAETLAVRPISDEILKAVTGAYECDYEEGPVAWSNELVLHVIELKMLDPSPTLSGWAAAFSADVRRINEILKEHNARLLPGAMHPTMRPENETRLWPHENREIYATYDRIFGARRHGWANLQSCHLNLPFHGDEEFGRLHAAIRPVLPLLPALAASSPMMESRVTGILDNRLHVYCTHQARIPSAMGFVIPEPVYTRADYEERIFKPMFAEIRPHDPSGILQREFLNARGAIARFERDAIEIRLLDVQETPVADLAICQLVTAVVRALADERWLSLDKLEAVPTDILVSALTRVIRDGDRAEIDDPDHLRVFGLSKAMRAGEVWQHLLDAVSADMNNLTEFSPSLKVILEQGPLARRLSVALGDDPSAEQVRSVYGRLATCLAESRMFTP